VQNLQNAAGKSAGCLSVQSDLLLSLLSMPRGLRLRLQKADEAGRPKRRVLIFVRGSVRILKERFTRKAE